MSKKINIYTVRLAIEVEEDQLCEDVISTILSEQCKAFMPESCLLDWEYDKSNFPKEIEVDDDFGFDSGIPELTNSKILKYIY